MTIRIEALQRSLALVGAVLFTTALVFASTPIVPIA
jgi:hypothetical protein